ncbi:YibE/F [Candidatus Peregrinibacteria bacterium CG10_big_fil_rev_8_21_14_0_10_36_19]|nr:MAG: YibE/F [Candidatus Peregrinibacteria bacterium CG10_big_fil_rev_8_21_14_0_10_36_19]
MSHHHDHTHDHSHTHQTGKKYKISLSIILALCLGYSFFAIKNQPQINDQNQKAVSAEVQEVTDYGDERMELTLKIDSGEEKGKQITVVEDQSLYLNRREFKVGDEVVLQQDLNPENSAGYYISDYKRTGVLMGLAFLFILTVIIITGWQGIGSVVGLLLSFIILFNITLPLILNGTNPITAAILSAVLIIPATFYSSHGMSKKTTIAAISTIATLIFAGLLATFFAKLGNLTGLSSEEASYLQVETAEKINFKGLLLSGMLLGLLGVLDDITISQASIVKQLKGANPNISKSELYSRAMSVGRDHISSMVNTLILIYAGSALPLLLLFVDYAQPLNQILNIEPVAEEVIRTLVGSVGLILAVPVTTMLAIAVYHKKK